MSQNEFNDILEKYIPLIKSMSLSFPQRHREDIIQEGFLGLSNACNAYDEKKGIPFEAFACICIKRRMINAYEYLNKDENIEYLDENIAAISINDDIIEKRHVQNFFVQLEKNLSKLESDVLKLYLTDYSYEQIAGQLDINTKTVDNTIMRIKRKIKQQYN